MPYSRDELMQTLGSLDEQNPRLSDYRVVLFSYLQTLNKLLSDTVHLGLTMQKDPVMPARRQRDRLGRQEGLYRCRHECVMRLRRDSNCDQAPSLRSVRGLVLSQCLQHCGTGTLTLLSLEAFLSGRIILVQIQLVDTHQFQANQQRRGISQGHAAFLCEPAKEEGVRSWVS